METLKVTILAKKGNRRYYDAKRLKASESVLKASETSYSDTPSPPLLPPPQTPPPHAPPRTRT